MFMHLSAEMLSSKFIPFIAYMHGWMTVHV